MSSSFWKVCTEFEPQCSHKIVLIKKSILILPFLLWDYSLFLFYFFVSKIRNFILLKFSSQKQNIFKSSGPTLGCFIDSLLSNFLWGFFILCGDLEVHLEVFWATPTRLPKIHHEKKMKNLKFDPNFNTLYVYFW